MENLIDQPLLYEFRFVGGPSDGLVNVMETPLADRPILTLPGRPLDLREGIDGAVEMGTSRSVYAMIDRCEDRALDRRMVIVTYGFAAFESLVPKPTTRLAQRLLELWRGLGCWMLAPVDYPLNCRGPS